MSNPEDNVNADELLDPVDPPEDPVDDETQNADGDKGSDGNWNKARQDYDQKLAVERKAREAAEVRFDAAAAAAEADRKQFAALAETIEQLRAAPMRNAEGDSDTFDDEMDAPAHRKIKGLESQLAAEKQAREEIAAKADAAAKAVADLQGERQAAAQTATDKVQGAAVVTTIAAGLEAKPEFKGVSRAKAIANAKTALARQGLKPEGVGGFLNWGSLVASRLDAEYRLLAHEAVAKRSTDTSEGFTTDSNSGSSAAGFSEKECADVREVGREILARVRSQ